MSTIEKKDSLPHRDFLRYHNAQYQNSCNIFKDRMNDFDEIQRITENFKKNKYTAIKMGHQIDPTAGAPFSQYDGFIKLSEDGEELEIYCKKPIPKLKMSTVCQEYEI